MEETGARKLLQELVLVIGETLPAGGPASSHKWAVDAVRSLLDSGPNGGVPSLTAVAGSDPDRRAALADLVSALARRLAPEDRPPTAPAALAAWRQLLATASELYGSGVAPMGRISFISDRLLELMVAEASVELPDRPPSGPRTAARGGRALRSLAVSGKLQSAVSGALGIEIEPSYHATYLYDPPGSHVRTHLDTRDYEIIFHLVLEHDLPPDGGPGSALVVHLPGRSGPCRIPVGPGEAVALRGRGTVHSWEPLGDGERRLLTGIGWTRSAR